MHMHKGKSGWGQGEKVAICTLRGKTSGETSTTNTLVLDFRPLEPWENKRHFVMAALAEYDKYKWNPEEEEVRSWNDCEQASTSFVEWSVKMGF